MISFKQVSFTYPDAEHPTLKDVTLHIEQGQFVLVVGASGSGKSTLLRCINGLVPHFSGGALSGAIRVAGLDPVEAGPQKMSHKVGFVFQDPESQFVLERVEDEIAFALENAGIPPHEIDQRINAVLSLLALSHLRKRRLETLSGGERQKVAIAAALVLQPGILILDEPTSQLDAQSAREVIDAVIQLNREKGLTIILAEHRLERVLSAADQIIYITRLAGEVRCGSREKILPQMDIAPPIVHLGKRLGWKPLPVSVTQVAEYLTQSQLTPKPPNRSIEQRQDSVGPPILRARGIQAGYNGKDVLHSTTLDLHSGEIACLLGRNGAGKTTLLKSLVGLLPLRSGEIFLQGEEITHQPVSQRCQRIGYLPQDPNMLLFAESVSEELKITLRNHGLLAQSDQPGMDERVDSLLGRLGLQETKHTYPRDLSVGERQRVALGAVTITHPGVLLLDEPTRGLDYYAKENLISLLRTWRDDGMAILVVTHDVEFVALLADRVLIMEDGIITQSGKPTQVLPKLGDFAPQLARLFPHAGILTVDNAIAALQSS